MGESEQRGRVLRGIFLAFFGAACWGFSATCASYLMSAFGVDVCWLAFARLIIAGPVFLIVAIATDRQRLASFFSDGPMILKMVAFSVVGVVLMQITYISAVKYAGAGNALLLQETGLIVIMAITCVRAHRAPRGRELVALVLALAGTACIATQGQWGSFGINPLGVFWGLTAGLALAGHNVIPGSLLDKYGSIITNGVAMTLGAIILVPVAQPWNSFVPLPTEGWLAFAAIVAFGTILAYFAYLQGIKEAGPMRASMIAVFEPISGMFFSSVWLGAAVTPFDLAGCALIVAMMVLVAKD